MALPSSGTLSLSQVNVELGRASNAAISLGETAVRNLFGVASGAISMSNGYGKSTAFVFNQTIAAHVQNYNLRNSLIAAGWNQTTPVLANVTINSGIWVGATSTGVYAFDATGSFPAGSQLTLTNNGFIAGCGGAGGAGGGASVWSSPGGCSGASGGGGAQGGPALGLGLPTELYNNAYLWAGGGGGGGGGGGAASFTSKPGYTGYAYSGGGGGGGAGWSGGAGGGAGGVSRATPMGSSGYGGNGAAGYNAADGTGAGGGGNGSAGPGTYSGAGGAGGNHGAGGGGGGNASGNAYQYRSFGGGGGGGLAGYYIVGGGNATWYTTGDRRGYAA